MLKHDDSKPTTAGQDAFVDAIRRAYVPEKLASSRRVVLERELWARIEAAGRRSWREPALALVAIAAAVLWFARPAGPDAVVMLAALETDAWEYELLFTDDALEDPLGGSRGDSLPAGYADIEMFFEAE